MTNSEELRKEIKNSGLKLSFIAEAMGIHIESLRRKINNESVFKTTEAAQLCHILHIESPERQHELFFCDKC